MKGNMRLFNANGWTVEVTAANGKRLTKRFGNAYDQARAFFNAVAAQAGGTPLADSRHPFVQQAAAQAQQAAAAQGALQPAAAGAAGSSAAVSSVRASSSPPAPPPAGFPFEQPHYSLTPLVAGPPVQKKGPKGGHTSAPSSHPGTGAAPSSAPPDRREATKPASSSSK